MQHWQLKRKEIKDRDRCRVAATTMLQATCLPEDVHDMPAVEPRPVGIARCRLGCADDEQVCLCVDNLHLHKFSQGGNPQWLRWQKMLMLTKASGCRASMSMLGFAMQELASLIENNFDQWKAEDFLKCPGLVLHGRGAKRLRTDPHAKQAAIEEALQEGRASKTSSLVHTLKLGSDGCAQVWMEQGLAMLQATSRLAFASPGILSCTLDGSRIGKPAKELLQGVQYQWPEDVSAVLPPQDGCD